MRGTSLVSRRRPTFLISVSSRSRCVRAVHAGSTVVTKPSRKQSPRRLRDKFRRVRFVHCERSVCSRARVAGVVGQVRIPAGSGKLKSQLERSREVRGRNAPVAAKGQNPRARKKIQPRNERCRNVVHWTRPCAI